MRNGLYLRRKQFGSSKGLSSPDVLHESLLVQASCLRIKANCRWRMADSEGAEGQRPPLALIRDRLLKVKLEVWTVSNCLTVLDSPPLPMSATLTSKMSTTPRKLSFAFLEPSFSLIATPPPDFMRSLMSSSPVARRPLMAATWRLVIINLSSKRKSVQWSGGGAPISFCGEAKLPLEVAKEPMDVTVLDLPDLIDMGRLARGL